MLTLVLGQTGHGKMQYAIREAVNKAKGKKLLVVTQELSLSDVSRRIFEILSYDKIQEPASIRMTSEFSMDKFSEDIGNYDVVVLKGVYPEGNIFNGQTSIEKMNSLITILRGFGAAFPGKEIIVTVNLNRLSQDFDEVSEKFFNKKEEVSSVYNEILVYRDSENRDFRVLNLADCSTKYYTSSDFLCRE